MIDIPYENLLKLNKPLLRKKQFLNALGSGSYIRGQNVKEFETKFAEYLNVQYCVGVGNGYDALYIALKTSSELYPEKSDVIMPANSYVATVLAVHNAGLTPKFVDIEKNSIFPSFERINSLIDDNTNAILLTHLYGFFCNALIKLTRNNDREYLLIEDCAQSTGTMFQAKHAGSFGDFACHSFYPTKNLGSLGDGGAITTNSYSYFDKIKNFGNYGSHQKYINTQFGVNSRLDEIQAAFLIGKLEQLPNIIKRKRDIAKNYYSLIRGEDIFKTHNLKSGASFHIFPIFSKSRDKLREVLKKNGIATEIHYPILPIQQQIFEKPLQLFPNALKAANSELSLPISATMTMNQVEYIAEQVNQFR